MRIHRYRGLFVLALWQAAPIGVDEHGRTRIGIGVGAGQLEYANLNCDGSVINSQTAPYRMTAVEAEHWLKENKVRLHGSLGLQSSDSASANGVFGVTLLSYEGQHFGIGGGVGFIPTGEWVYSQPNASGVQVTHTTPVPSFAIRGGNRDRVHVRLEVFPPGAQTYTEFVRFVVGFNRFSMTNASGSFGLGVVGDVEAEPTAAAVGELFAPVARNVLVGGRAFLSPGNEKAQVGLTAGFKLQLH